MAVAQEVVENLYLIKLGASNVYLIDHGDQGLTVVDAGFPADSAEIEEGIVSIGREPSELTDIVITHAHPDHLGSAAHLSAGGTIPISLPFKEADIARSGRFEVTEAKPLPGLFNRFLFWFLIARKSPYEFPGFQPQKDLVGGETLKLGGSALDVVHTPGHTPGHVSLLWKQDRNVLIAGDAVANIPRLNYALNYEDLDTGKQSATKLAQLDFEVAVFGHGKPILSNASARFAEKFG